MNQLNITKSPQKISWVVLVLVCFLFCVCWENIVDSSFNLLYLENSEGKEF